MKKRNAYSLETQHLLSWLNQDKAQEAELEKSAAVLLKKIEAAYSDNRVGGLALAIPAWTIRKEIAERLAAFLYESCVKQLPPKGARGLSGFQHFISAVTREGLTRVDWQTISDIYALRALPLSDAEVNELCENQQEGL